MKQLLFYMILGLLLSACAPAANVRVDDQQLGTIQVGQTTEQEVVQRLGNPTSVTVTPERRVLVYAHTVRGNVEKQMVTAGAAVVGGFMAGPVGSLAGGLLGGSAMPNNQLRDELSIDIDPVTGTVMNIQRQYTTDYQ